MNSTDYLARSRPAIDVEIAPGFTFKLRRPNLQALLAGGHLPVVFTRDVGRAWQTRQGNPEASPADVVAGMSPQDLVETMKFVKDIVIDVCVEPRVTEGPTTEGALSILEIADEHLMSIFNWAMSGGAGLPVPLRNGEVGLDGLRGFPPGGEGNPSSAARGDG
jgi:hypothetical protein